MECKIRYWRIEDAEDIAETLNNKNILDNLRDGIPFPYTVHDAREFIQAMNAADSESTFSFAITVDDKAIGSIGAFRQSNIHSRTAEVGYYIAEPYWGQGNRYKRCETAMRICFSKYGYNPAFCRTLCT